MLSGIEGTLTSIVAGSLSARTHLSTLEAPGPAPTLDAGKGAVLVSIAEVARAATFAPAQTAINGTQSRRVLPIDFGARVEFFLRPAQPDPAGLAAARLLLLDDMALVSHSLGAHEVASGKAFAANVPDPGFHVTSFLLDTGGAARDLDGQHLTGTLHYSGRGEIWPPGVTQQEGEIRAVDSVLVSLPLAIEARDTVARAGQSLTIRVRALGGQRVLSRQPPRTAPLRLAVTVVSDAPPAQRGAITGGVAGTETGFRVIELTLPETSIGYRAPASGISRTRLEYVAIHLATPDGQRGVFLGSAAVRLEP
jgi:hypothetical protein